MRRLLPPLVVSLALAGALLLAPAAPATSTCTPPHVSGLTITWLQESEIGCEHAREQLVYVIHHGTPARWTCGQSSSGNGEVHLSCHITSHKTHKFGATWYAH